MQKGIERRPSSWEKFKYVLFTQQTESYLEKYLRLQENQGQINYAEIDNEAILRNYGIILPEVMPSPQVRENSNGNGSQIVAAPNEAAQAVDDE